MSTSGHHLGSSTGRRRSFQSWPGTTRRRGWLPHVPIPLCLKGCGSRPIPLRLAKTTEAENPGRTWVVQSAGHESPPRWWCQQKRGKRERRYRNELFEEIICSVLITGNLKIPFSQSLARRSSLGLRGRCGWKTSVRSLPGSRRPSPGTNWPCCLKSGSQST